MAGVLGILLILLSYIKIVPRQKQLLHQVRKESRICRRTIMLVTLHFLYDFEYFIKTINDLYFAAGDVFDVNNFSCFQAIS